jgi:hypothetical protein
VTRKTARIVRAQHDVRSGIVRIGIHGIGAVKFPGGREPDVVGFQS